MLLLQCQLAAVTLCGVYAPCMYDAAAAAVRLWQQLLLLLLQFLRCCMAAARASAVLVCRRMLASWIKRCFNQ